VAKARAAGPSDWEDLYALYDLAVQEERFLQQERRRAFLTYGLLLVLFWAGTFTGVLWSTTPFVRWLTLLGPLGALGVSVLGQLASRHLENAALERSATRMKLEHDLGLHKERGGGAGGRRKAGGWIETEPYVTVGAIYAGSRLQAGPGPSSWFEELRASRERPQVSYRDWWGRFERPSVFFCLAAVLSGLLLVLCALHAGSVL